MSEKVIATCRYRHPEIGTINVKVNASAKSLRARWVGPEVHITVPRNCPAETYDNFLDQHSARLIELRPKPRFSLGIIEGNLVDFEICYGSCADGIMTRIEMERENPRRGKLANGKVILNKFLTDRLGFDDDEVQNSINKMLQHLAWSATGLYLLPHARLLADRVGQSPLLWDVKHSKTRLGWCNSNGFITLSPRLIFLPIELAEYVIYHEIAHLSEMNHSSAFHSICDRYCGGREAEYNAALKNFTFPVY